MLPFVAAVTLALAAQTPPQQSSPADAAAATQGKKTMMQHDKSAPAPDLELIGYLGDYGDAADGLDPMGLAENVAALKPAKTPPKPQQDKHP